MTTRLIGLSGYARSGKDSVAHFLRYDHGFASRASGDLVRDVAYAANPWINLHDDLPALGIVRLQELVDADGWEYAKSLPEVRRILQDLGTEGCRNVFGADCWIAATMREVATEPAKQWVITDVRFPNEADRVVRAGGRIWCITRPGVGPLNDHATETQMHGYPFDLVLPNDGTLEDLRRRVGIAVTGRRHFGGEHYTGGSDTWSGI